MGRCVHEIKMQLHIIFVFSDPAKKPPAALECLTFNDKLWDATVKYFQDSVESAEDCLSFCKSKDTQMFMWRTPQYRTVSLRKRCYCMMKDGGELRDLEGTITGEVSCTGKFYSYQKIFPKQ